MTDLRVEQTMRDGVPEPEDRRCGTCSHFTCSGSVRHSRIVNGETRSDYREYGVCELRLQRWADGAPSFDVAKDENRGTDCMFWEEY